MTQDSDYIQIQSLLDGELSAGDADKMRLEISENPEWKNVLDELKWTSEIVRSNETCRILPVDTEFYWLQIARGIGPVGIVQPADSHKESTVSMPLVWLKRCLQLGAAVLLFAGIMMFLDQKNEPRNAIAFGDTEAILNEFGELEIPEGNSSFLIQSPDNEMTVVWIDYQMDSME
ncbi:MAG TPA: hypothetical protein EYQ50_28020 [Verrucomicrobiales bacterium]|nr:hypothetical protein [Verrucomicrobiales bacterium]HIL68260.1 hypothetical protein [Verrucomicrobiota bacterium]